jgi:hypothetical protein
MPPAEARCQGAAPLACRYRSKQSTSRRWSSGGLPARAKAGVAGILPSLDLLRRPRGGYPAKAGQAGDDYRGLGRLQPATGARLSRKHFIRRLPRAAAPPGLSLGLVSSPRKRPVSCPIPRGNGTRGGSGNTSSISRRSRLPLSSSQADRARAHRAAAVRPWWKADQAAHVMLGLVPSIHRAAASRRLTHATPLHCYSTCILSTARPGRSSRSSAPTRTSCPASP